MDKNKTPAICVFCGSAFGYDPRFREAARATGTGLARAGWSLVFGGGNVGLMGDVSRAAQEGGAQVQGIIPGFLKSLEAPTTEAERLIVTQHMQERKNLMLQMSDAFLVLPGGLGTFDEFFEVMIEAHLGVHKKPIVVVNVAGYYNALDALLKTIVEAQFTQPTALSLYHLADGPDIALKILEDHFHG